MATQPAGTSQEHGGLRLAGEADPDLAGEGAGEGQPTAGVELRFHRGETRCEQDRLFIETYVGSNRTVTAIVILRVPSMVAILVQERLAVRAPIPLARNLAAPIENINDPVKSGVALQGRLIVSVEVRFLEFIAIRIVFPLHDGIAVRDDYRLSVRADESYQDFVASLVVD